MDNNIQKTAQADEHHSESIEQRPRRALGPLRTIGWVASSVTLLGLVVQALRLASQYLASNTDPVQFITGNLVNALIFIAIVAQVLIYRKQRDIMEQQWLAMKDSLTETRKLVAQTERATRAAEQSVEIAKEAFYVGEAPYFGTSEIVFRWAKGPVAPRSSFVRATRQPELIITFMNGGKTPAWHFSAYPHLELGEFGPVERKRATLNVVHDNECPDAENTFYPSGAQRCIKYRGRDEFSSTEIEAINARTQTLFLIIDMGYSDMRDDRKTCSFLRCFNPETRGFGDCGGRQN